MPKYELNIWWSHEDDCFLIATPKLPGCMADGATGQVAEANALIVIEEWLETARELGREIPEPRHRLLNA